MIAILGAEGWRPHEVRALSAEDYWLIIAGMVWSKSGSKKEMHGGKEKTISKKDLDKLRGMFGAGRAFGE